MLRCIGFAVGVDKCFLAPKSNLDKNRCLCCDHLRLRMIRIRGLNPPPWDLRGVWRAHDVLHRVCGQSGGGVGGGAGALRGGTRTGVRRRAAPGQRCRTGREPGRPGCATGAACRGHTPAPATQWVVGIEPRVGRLGSWLWNTKKN